MILRLDGNGVLPTVCVVAVPRRLQLDREGVAPVRAQRDFATQLDAAVLMSGKKAKRRFSSMPLVLWLSLSQPRCEVGQTLDRAHILDGNGHGTGLPNDDNQLLASGDASIEEIPGEHRIMLRRQGKHHHRIFRPLAFMHGGRIGQGHFIQFTDIIADDPPSKSMSIWPSSTSTCATRPMSPLKTSFS